MPITVDLPHNGTAKIYADGNIYVSKEIWVLRSDGKYYPELSPSESVGHVGLYADGWGVMIYCHGYPERFPTKEDAMEFAANLFKARPNRKVN